MSFFFIALLMGEKQMSFVENVINGKILWGTPALCAIMIAFCFISVKSGFIQLRGFFKSFRCIFPDKTKSSGGISGIEAFFTSLGGSIGTGNITGVLVALINGGPGSIFWMWFSAFFGMAVKACEIKAGKQYRVRYNGAYHGGPMFYMERGLNKGGKLLSGVFCMATVLVSFGMGNIVQTNAVVSSVEAFFNVNMFFRILSGSFLSVLIYRLLCGGIKKTGKVSSRLVPVMSIVYIVLCACVIIKCRTCFFDVIKRIFLSAFGIKSINGAVSGLTLKKVISTGISKGIFSNEAGLGTAAIVHSGVDDKENSALSGIIEVFVDTFVICSLTAVALLSCEKAGFVLLDSVSPAVIARMFSCVFPDIVSKLFVCVSLIFFAFSSVLPWGCYGTSAFEYLFSSKYNGVYRILFALCAFLGAVMNVNAVWIISDTFNALMFIPNMVTLLIINKKTLKTSKNIIKSVELSF